MEGMKDKGGEVKEGLQEKVRKFKHASKVKKKETHDKDGVGIVVGKDVSSITLSSEEQGRDHTSDEGKHSLMKNQSTIRDNAHFQILVHWKGILDERVTWRSKNDWAKHQSIMQHYPQGDLSSFFSREYGTGAPG